MTNGVAVTTCYYANTLLKDPKIRLKNQSAVVPLLHMARCEHHARQHWENLHRKELTMG